jgi:hypothetical protein
VNYVTKTAWQDKATFVYVVHFPIEKVVKIGVAVSLARPEHWVQGGGTLEMLLSHPEGPGVVMVDAETRLLRAVKEAGFVRPETSREPEALKSSGDVGKEFFAYETIQKYIQLTETLPCLVARNLGLNVQKENTATVAV